MPEMRINVRQAVTWRIIAQLFRRHEQSANLRLLETHPCSGLYDCLSIFIGGQFPEGRHVCDFSRCLHMHVFANGHRMVDTFASPDGADYVHAFLMAGNPASVIDHAERQIGLPHVAHSAPTTRTVLMLRMIAGVMERFAFESTRIRPNCGWGESYIGSGLRHELRTFPTLNSAPPETDWRKQLDFGSQQWFFTIGSKNDAPVVVSATGHIHYSNGREAWPFWQDFKTNGRKLTPLVDRLRRDIGSYP